MHHVGVRKQRGEASLAQEHVGVPLVARTFRKKAFQRANPLEAVVRRFERDLDDAHAAAADRIKRSIALQSKGRGGHAIPF